MEPSVSRQRLEAAQAANEELSAILEVTDEALSTLDLPHLLDALLARLVRVMGADAGALMLLEEGALVVRATTGFDPVAAESVKIPIGEGFAGRIAASGRPRYVADAQRDPEPWGPFLRDHGIVSMLGVPLRHGPSVIGVLHVDWKTLHPELPKDLRLLQTAAARSSAAIVNARLYEESQNARASLAQVVKHLTAVGERLGLAIDAGELAIWDWDLATGSLLWHGHQARVFGFLSEHLGASQKIRDIIDPEDLDGLRASIGRALEQRSPQSHEFRITAPDGTVRWIAVRGRPSYTPDGRPARMTGVAQDVTARRRADADREALLSQLRALSARLARAREEEALRISREIHDELGQLLTALNLDASWLKGRLARLEVAERDALLSRASAMAELAQRTIGAVQRISEELRPGALDQLGLEAALSQLVGQTSERAGLSASLVSALGERRLDPAVETGVFRIAQELLTNVARHAEARNVRVELATDDGALRLRVVDDGRGVTPDELDASRSLGLVGLRERALLLGGSAVLTGTPGRGTEALVTIPLGAPP